jgi:hypothetical protein
MSAPALHGGQAGKTGYPAAPGPGEDDGAVGRGMLLAGRYRLQERLTERRGSVTWRATDEVCSRPVTVLTLAPGSRRTRTVISAARTACRVSESRLAKIFDADGRAAPPYVVTEWPRGTCLSERLAGGPVPPRQAAEMIAAAADAVAVAHQAGLAHLCLTPDSVWCQTDGSLMITGLQVDAALTGARAADPAREDTRGLARLLYAALTGYWPGAGPTRLPPAPRWRGRVPAPRQIRPAIPARLDAVTCRALHEESFDIPRPIFGPAQLAMELAAIARALRPAAVPSSPASPDTAAAPRSPAEVRQGGPAQSSRMPTGRLPAIARRKLPAIAHRKLPAILVVLALIATGGWLLGSEMSAPGAHPPAAAAGPLTPVRVAAFGRQGEGDGDNPQDARFAIDHNATTAWRTHWYATAALGNLAPGTGLLLDMGHPVTVTAARITLGSAHGASLQVRVGPRPAWADMPAAARTAGAGGAVRLPFSHPAHGRYVLLWFTRLPPDPAGTFQAAVYDVRLDGTR